MIHYNDFLKILQVFYGKKMKKYHEKHDKMDLI